MKPLKLGLIAALTLAVAAPATVYSQGRGKPAAPAAVSEKDRQRGMAEAPAIAQSAGVTCQVADARFIGEDKKTKKRFYEVDCAQGMGFALEAAEGATPVAYPCIEASAATDDGKQGGLACRLAGNQDIASEVAAVVKAAAPSCTLQNWKWVGRTPTASFVEAECAGDVGYIIQSSYPKFAQGTPQAMNCLSYDEAGGNLQCTLGSKEARAKVIDKLASASNCTVAERRYIGIAKDGGSVFEAKCSDGKGYILKAKADGSLEQALECAKATAYYGGCTLVDARAVASEQAALYTRFAKAAGFNCDVEKYAVGAAPGGKEAVEMVCSNRQDGGIGVFDAQGKGQVYDCAKAIFAGFKCGLNNPEAMNATYTADLKGLGKDTCKVKSSRLVGRTQKGTYYLEVSCTDGLAGYVMEYSTEPVKAVQALGCNLVKDMCKLPGNTTGAAAGGA